MPFEDFKDEVASYLTRAASALVSEADGTDLIMSAANMAKLWAQRRMDFEYQRTTAQLVVDYTNGASIAAATYFNTANAVAVKSITGAYVLPSGVPGPYNGVPIRIYSRRKDAFTDDLTLRDTLPDPNWITSVPLPPLNVNTGYDLKEYALVQNGQNLYVTNYTQMAFTGTNITVALDVLQWMPPYTGVASDDFFLQYCRDWMLFRTVGTLNFFLKEDDRVQINKAVIDEAWDAVVVWDTYISSGNETSKLN